MKSTLRYLFPFDSSPFSWNSKKQAIVAQSITEAEYNSIAVAANPTLWLRKLLLDLDEKQEVAMVILCDNKFAIAIAKNSIQHVRIKHTSIKYHTISEVKRNGEVKYVHCSSEVQLIDVLTKALPKTILELYA